MSKFAERYLANALDKVDFSREAFDKLQAALLNAEQLGGFEGFAPEEFNNYYPTAPNFLLSIEQSYRRGKNLKSYVKINGIYVNVSGGFSEAVTRLESDSGLEFNHDYRKEWINAGGTGSAVTLLESGTHAAYVVLYPKR